MKHTLPLLLLMSMSSLFCCSPSKKENSRFKIVTTTGMIADAIKNIVNEEVEVTALMGPGVDPHLYKAAQGDLKLLQDADIIVYNGLHLEGKMTDIFEKLSRTKPVYALSDGVPKEKLRKAGSKDAVDPHIWFDVQLWSLAVKQLNKQLSMQHPNICNNQKAITYFSQLDSLHAATTDKINTIPQNQRVLITAHDAFGYFGDAYNIEVRGLQGISTVAQAGLRDVNELVEMIVNRKIKAIFIESSIPQKQIEIVSETCEEKGHQLAIGGTLYSDAMGAPLSPEGNYIGMVSHNVNTIVKALK